MTDDKNMADVTKLMREMSLEITVSLVNSGLTPQEAMVVLGQTLAVAFKAGGISKLQAVHRFSQLANIVYDEVKERDLQ